MSALSNTTSSVREKLSVTRFSHHPESHVAVRDQAVCRDCVLKLCVDICPGNVYRYTEDPGLTIAHETCLECGSCRIVCEFDNLEWDYPPGGFGVDYRCG